MNNELIITKQLNIVSLYLHSTILIISYKKLARSLLYLIRKLNKSHTYESNFILKKGEILLVKTYFKLY